ncbi:diiron oxygenase [Nocardia goodfellowii]
MLLDSAATSTFDINADIDWGAGPVPEMMYLSEHRCALYGTEIWAMMTPEQRIEFSRHQMASMHAIEIWVETLLNTFLMRQVLNSDVATPLAWHLYTEIADECRHSTMFGRIIAAAGAPTYGPPAWAFHLTQAAAALAPPFIVVGMTLAMFFEEYGDALQRELAADENVQPLVRRVSHIHVVEESRHLTFARAELAERIPHSPIEKAIVAAIYGPVAFLVTRFMVPPTVYENVGLDARLASRAAKTNKYWRESQRWFSERAMHTFAELGIRNRFGDAICRFAGVL